MSRPRVTTPTYSLTRRGNTYYVQWWTGASKRRVSCGTADPVAAERFLADFKAGRGIVLPPPTSTLGAILDGYEAEQRPKVHSSTLGQVCATLRRYFGPLSPDLLTRERVKAYQAARRKEGPQGAAAKFRKTTRPLSDGTLIRELGTLRAALAWAVRQTPSWLEKAPYVDMPPAPLGRDRWLTRQEATKLLEGCTALHVRVFVALALHTAARSGAILTLTWHSVELAERTIDFGRAKGLKRRARHMPINDALFPVLQEARAAATTQFVVEFRGGPVHSIKSGFRAACRRARLSGVTPHILRHTAVSWMMQRDVPIPMVAAYAAMSVQMVENRYGHHSPKWLRQAAEALTGE